MCTAGIEQDVALHRHRIEDYESLCTVVTGTTQSPLLCQRLPSSGFYQKSYSIITWIHAIVRL